MIFGREEIHNTLKSKSTTISTSPSINPISESFSIYEYGLQCMRETDELIREYMKDSYISAGYNINEAFSIYAFATLSPCLSIKSAITLNSYNVLNLA